MSGREAFGPNLRRIRVQRGIALEDIARRTKVSLDLWYGLERNDFSRWPAGVFARAYIREYAHAIGVDADVTVDEFCRWFSHGDRRAERIVRGQAELVGHALEWSDDLPIPDRRARAEPEPAPPGGRTFTPRVRALVALADIGAVVAAAALVTPFVPVGFWTSVALLALAYHLCGLAALGASPAVAVVDWYLSARRPSTQPPGVRLLRGSERVKV